MDLKRFIKLVHFRLLTRVFHIFAPLYFIEFSCVTFNLQNGKTKLCLLRVYYIWVQGQNFMTYWLVYVTTCTQLTVKYKSFIKIMQNRCSNISVSIYSTLFSCFDKCVILKEIFFSWCVELNILLCTQVLNLTIFPLEYLLPC